MKFRRRMKSGIFMVVMAMTLASGCGRIVQQAETASFRDQISELVRLKDAGEISDEEYRDSRQNLLNRMLH